MLATPRRAGAKDRAGSGIDLADLRARQVTHADFVSFDHILAMDRQNLDSLLFVCPKMHKHKLKLFLEYAPGLKTAEVPDPYYGGEKGFDKVFDMWKRPRWVFGFCAREPD